MHQRSSDDVLTRLQISAYVLLCLIWGSTWLAIRITVAAVPPVRAAALRFAIAAVILAVVIAIRRMPMPSAREMKSLIALALGMMAVPYGLLFWAERRIPSSTTAVLFSSLPLVTALLTPWMRQRTIPRRAVYAMLAGTAGVAMIFSSTLTANLQMLLGGAAVIAAVVTSAWSSIYAKNATADIHPVVSTAFQLAFGAVFLVVASLTERHEPSLWDRSALAALSFLVVFGSVIAFSLYYWLLLRLEPYQMATINLIVPIIAIAEGALFAHERVPFVIIAASLVVIASVAAVLRASADEDTMLSIASIEEEHP